MKDKRLQVQRFRDHRFRVQGFRVDGLILSPDKPELNIDD
jgi:hypothetical protein